MFTRASPRQNYGGAASQTFELGRAKRLAGGFVRLSYASHRNGGGDPCNDVRGLEIHQGRLDRTGAQDVRANATVLQLHGPGSPQIGNRGLGRAVGTEGSRAFDACDGADENDRSSVVHERQGILYRKQRALDVEIEQLVEMRLREAASGANSPMPALATKISMRPFALTVS